MGINDMQAIKNSDLATDYQQHGKTMFRLGMLAGIGITVAALVTAYTIAGFIPY